MFQGLAWVSTKYTNRSLDYPDIEFHFVSGSPGSDGGRQIRKVDGVPLLLTWPDGLNTRDVFVGVCKELTDA